MPALLDIVELTKDLPDDGLRRGDVGTIVEVFAKPERAYEVEFSDDEGRTTALVTLLPHEVRVVRRGAKQPAVAHQGARAVPAG